MQKVDPQKLTPGETYYLELNIINNEWYDKDNDISYRAKGIFIKYNQNEYGTNALFENIMSVNNKPLSESLLPDKTGQLLFHVAPNGCAMNIYKPINGLREEAARRMINSQFPYPEEDVISTSNMFSEEPYVVPPTYEQTPEKTNIGDQLANKIGKYFGGKRRRKTLKSRKSRKSRKTRKTKSRRRR